MENNITMKFSILHGCMDEKTLKQLLDLYHKWQDEVKKEFIMYSGNNHLENDELLITTE